MEIIQNIVFGCLLFTAIKLVQGKCEPVIFSTTKVRNTHVEVKMIELIIHSAKFNYQKLPSLSVAFQPSLVLDEDYQIDFLKPENLLPLYVNPHKHQNISLLGLVLKPGKSWLKNSNKTKDLHITDAVACDTPEEAKAHQSSNNQNLRIASFFGPKQHHCPTLPSLPGATPELNAYLKDVLHTCANLRIFKSRKLNGHHINSYSLLLPNIAMILVDGSDQNNITDAAREVDTFLAPHSVLDLAWEPYSDNEPKWFVLIPRPRGMPGHLFAMLDTIQWHHPLVTSHRGEMEPQCNELNVNQKNCVMGCPGAFIHRVTASGWGADSWHAMLDTRRALFWNEPVQLAPIRMGHAKIGTQWEGKFGWTYTYGGCDSNFLDCYFLDHSPCPKVVVDPYDALSNYSRLKAWHLKDIGKVDESAFKFAESWWRNVLASEEPTDSNVPIPWSSVEHHHARPAEQVFYTYMWRPKHELRKEVHKRVNAFNLNEACAAMHVRRGDTVHHGGQSRAYIRVESYIRAAKPLMDTLGIKTIMLFTDSGSAIEEALNCTKEYPDVCDGIKFRYVEKKRFYGAEGGWENHFPSGSPQQELYTIQTEFALANKCSMIITGQSSYGDKLTNQMCCGFPLKTRGTLPHRCICPPKISVSQNGFGSCADGNLLLCQGEQRIKNLKDMGAVTQAPKEVWWDGYDEHLHYKLADDPSSIRKKVDDFIKEAKVKSCKKYDRGPPLGKHCTQNPK